MIKEWWLGLLRWYCERFFSRESLARVVAGLIPDGSRVLDIGCDDGTTALFVKKYAKAITVEGVDIQSNRKAKIVRKMYDGLHLPYKDKSVDVVMTLDVLHHTRQIPELLEEMGRVSRGLVLVKDHVRESWLDQVILSILDYVGNAPYGIWCEYNYPSKKEWLGYFDQARLRLVDQVCLGPRWWGGLQTIFVLRVKEGS